MKYIKDTTEIQLNNTVVTLGKFDGFHVGHQALFERVKSEKMTSVLFTFSTSPTVFFSADTKVIFTEMERMMMYEKLGFDYVIEYPFTEEIRSMSPETFIQKVLVEKLGVKEIIVGKDYGFGYKRQGTVDTLEKAGKEFGFKVLALEKVMYKEEEVSSTRIRECILKGEMQDAARMLGSPYYVLGEIVHGNQLGRTIGLPTINQVPGEEKVLPPNGVYASRIYLKGNTYYGITNVGCKPTVQRDKTMMVETFLFDFNENVYGEIALVELFDFVRPERKFSDLIALQGQINQDIQVVKSKINIK